jgi:hypothetical protein
LFGLLEPLLLDDGGGQSGFGDRHQVFTGMEPVENLHGVGEVFVDQPPDPIGAIPQDDQFAGQLSVVLDTGRPQ